MRYWRGDTDEVRKKKSAVLSAPREIHVQLYSCTVEGEIQGEIARDMLPLPLRTL